MNNEKLTQIIKEIYKRKKYSEDAKELLIEYLLDNGGAIDNLDEVSAEEVTAWHFDEYFNNFKDAEEYLKKYHSNGNLLQNIIEMMNYMCYYYDTRIENICELAKYKLEEEISWLINELL